MIFSQIDVQCTEKLHELHNDLPFLTERMKGNQRFVIRQKPCLFLLISFRFTLEISSNYNKLLLPVRNES